MRILRPGLALHRLPRAVSATPAPPPVTVYPNEVSGLLWWLDAGQDSRSDYQFITDWPDHSGNGYNFNASNPAYQMVYRTSEGPNNNPYVQYYWSGNDDPYSFRLTDSPTGVTSAHFFLVLQIENNPPPESRQAGLMTIGDGITNTRYPETSGTVYSNMLRSNTTSCTPWTGFNAFQNWHILEVSSATGAYNIYVNGTLQFTTASSTFYWQSYGITIGQSETASNANFVGGMSEWFIFDHVLSAGDRTSMLNYLNNRYFP